MYDAGVTNWKPQPRTVIEEARLASGLGQTELAALAGTSQPTLSAYERGKKSPGLAVAERIVNAAGWNIALQPRVSFTEHPAPPGFRFPFTVPDRLWRLEAPACFRTIKFFDLIDDDNDKFWWDLSDPRGPKTRLRAPAHLRGRVEPDPLPRRRTPHRPLERVGRPRTDAHPLGCGHRGHGPRTDRC